MSGIDAPDLVLRLLTDVLAVGVLGLLVSARRPQRGLLVVFTTFNLVLFSVMTVISARHIGPAVGFGLFAILSIIRLRSEPFSNQELSYFFSALGLALINGVHVEARWVAIALDVTILATLFLVDHPALHRHTTRMRVTLDHVVTDPELLRAELGRRLGVAVIEVSILDVDYVRESMRVMARTALAPGLAEQSGDMGGLVEEPA